MLFVLECHIFILEGMKLYFGKKTSFKTKKGYAKLDYNFILLQYFVSCRKKYVNTTSFYFLSNLISLSILRVLNSFDMRIGLISDTHSHLEESIFEYFEECDEIWHAGDIGSMELVERLEAFRPLKAVYGNIDDSTLRQTFTENLFFECGGVKVFMTHIGGYPGRYTARVRKLLQAHRPKLYICGHSHILKIMPDPKLDLLHINPGAAGVHGFHKMKTIVRFSLDEGKIHSVEVVELGLRGKIKTD